ncbi:MAG: M15 family metallopeptidase [Fimbriimonas sp.]
MISIAEPVTALRRVRIVERGEPLVDFLQECPALQLDRPRFNYRRETLLRKGVCERLCAANEALLGKGLHVRVVEGWRAPIIQRRMYRWAWERYRVMHPDWSEVKLKRHVNRFTAPMNARVPPPHTTGGAMDLALYRGDVPLDMMSPYEQRDYHGFPWEAPLLSDEARSNRDALAEALEPVGITNYPSEYWHWSYGDQGWAYRGGHSFAVYGAVTPQGWEAGEDDVDEPLVYQEGG